MIAIIDYIRTNHLDLIGITVGTLAATFAALAYFAQRIFIRKKVELCIMYRRNDTNVSVAATNEGRTLAFRSIQLVTPGFDPLPLDCPINGVEHGAPFNFSIFVGAINHIPVDVKSRIVFTLTNCRSFRSCPIGFAKMIHTAENAKPLVIRVPNLFQL